MNSPILNYYFVIGYEYFGLENGDECYCGDSASKFIPAPFSNCKKPCSGDQSEFCGSSWRMNVFQTDRNELPIISAAEAVLILSTYRTTNVPMVVSFAGELFKAIQIMAFFTIVKLSRREVYVCY